MNQALERLTGSFHYRSYRQFWIGSMMTVAAFRIQDVVLGWQMLELTDSAFLVGLVVFAHGVPLLVLSPLTGFLADRLDRRRIVAIALVLASASVILLALLTMLEYVQPWHLVAVSFLTGGTFTLYAPARLAILPNLVPVSLLLSASTVEYSSTRLMGFFGPIVAGALIDAFDISSALMVEVLLLSLAAVVFVRTRLETSDVVQRDRQEIGLLDGLGEAVAYLRQDRPLLAVVILGIIVVPFGMSYPKLMPVFARDVLGVGASTLGWMVGVSSLGTALAGFGIALVGEAFSKGRMVLLSAVVFGCGLLAFVFSRQVVLAIGLLFVVGLFAGVYLTLSQVLFQTRPPDGMRGRVMSAWGIVWGVLPFISLGLGGVAERWNVVAAMGISGVLCVVFPLGVAMARSHLSEL